MDLVTELGGFCFHAPATSLWRGAGIILSFEADLGMGGARESIEGVLTEQSLVWFGLAKRR